MGVLDIFSKKKTVLAENNTLFGQTQLGNQIVRQAQDGKGGANFQLLYVFVFDNDDVMHSAFKLNWQI